MRLKLSAVIVGILSDTHDRADAAHAGVDLLRGAGAGYFIHCGDVGSEAVLDVLAGLPSAFVFGNTDWDRRGLERYAKDVGVTCLGASGELELGGKRFAVVHGDDFALRRRLLDGQQFDYLLQGHTHARADERVGRTRLINPGALHRARPRTVATLDTAVDLLKFYELPDAGHAPLRRRG
jgi:putative phosphoesterase